MSRSLADLRASGLLERSVLGDLSLPEQRELEAALRSYPELREELRDIEQALERLAFAKTREPNPEVVEGALRSIRGVSALPTEEAKPSSPSGKTPTGLAAVLLVLALVIAAAAALYLWRTQQTLQDTIEAQAAELADCAAREAAKNERISVLDDLQRPDNRVAALTASDAFASASLLLYDNPTTGRNYLAVADLPQLQAGKAYQLWSLQEGTDPIALDVFGDAAAIVPVTREAGTATYAITVEEATGADVPNLEALVGTIDVSG